MSAFLVTLTYFLASAAAAPQASNSNSIPSRNGFKLVWSDTFSNPSLSQNWIIDTGNSYPGGPPNWGTGEIQQYTTSPSNLFVSPAGELNIVPIKLMGWDGRPQWTSARVESKRADFQCRSGGQMIIEARIFLPAGPAQEGVWAAFWAMGRNFRNNGNRGWPATGEWDIMEAVNGGNDIVGTIHCGTFPGGPCNEPNGVPGRASISRNVYNNFSLRIDRTASEWYNEYLEWSVNGRQYHRISGSQIKNFKTWKALVHEPFFLLFNVAMGGAFPDAIAGRTTPTGDTRSGYGMMVDWVAVYNK